MSQRIKLTEQYLTQRYLIDGLSTSKIAIEIGCCAATIQKRLKFYGITCRKDGILYPTMTREFLWQEYVINEKGMTEIGRMVGCPLSAVRRRLRRYGIRCRSKSELNDLQGKQFDKWTVIERAKEISHPETKWKCRCACGKLGIVSSANLTSGTSTQCRYCARQKLLGAKHPGWKGYGEISGSAWHFIQQSATKRNLVFDIEISDMWDLFLKQNRRCALSGQWIRFASACSRQSEATASLDRIDSSKGYVLGNIQWVHKDINKMKTDFREDRFVELCKMVSTHNCDAISIMGKGGYKSTSVGDTGGWGHLSNLSPALRS